MSKPKLALIPSGYKSGKVYSILPNDATGDFDFERQSIGTRVRKDGLIEEAKTEGSITNELLYSEDYSQSEWSKVRSTISTDQTLAPDGTNTADKIIPTVDNNTHRCDQVITLTNSAVYTLSFYAKEGGYNCIRASIGQTGLTFGSLASFNLNTETVSITGTVRNAEIQSIANDWYRCSISMDAGTSDRVVIGIGNNNSYSFAGDTTSGVFMWGAMVSEGALSDYIKTEGSQETKTVETFTDVPRLDWYNSNCPSLILEPQRTNLLKYSEDLTNAVWTVLSDGTGSNPVVTSNYSIAPNGTLTADRVVFDKGGGTSGTDYSIIRQFVSGTTQRVSSIYMKSNTNENYNIGVDDVGTVDVVTVTPQWQRFEHSGSAKFRLQLSLRQSQTSDFADVSIWGGQLEDGTYPTSYIKTEASTVTRLKDECLNGGDSDLFDITEGTFFVDSYVYNSGNQTTIGLSDGSDSNKLILIFQSYGTQVRVYSSGGVSSFLNLTFNQRNKIAVTFKENEYKFFINGASVGSDTNATVPTGMDRLNFSNRTNTANHFEGKIYDTRVYNRVLTEAEAIEITTL